MPRAKYGSVTYQILQILAKAKTSMLAFAIYNQLAIETDWLSFIVTLSQMTRRGRLKTDERKFDCDKCGTPHILYRITDDGKMRLAEKKATAAPIWSE